LRQVVSIIDLVCIVAVVANRSKYPSCEQFCSFCSDAPMQSRAGDLLVISLDAAGHGFSLAADADATQTSETRAPQV